MQKILKRWWFWVGVVILAVAVWWFWGYFSWLIGQAPVRDENARARAGWLQMQAEEAALEAQYRADTYGGTTPEETLRLFVEALEKKDFELASKYFVVENREDFLSEIQDSEKGGFLGKYIEILNYRYVVSISEDKSGADIDFFDSQNKQIHFGQLAINPFTKKWKILEL
ncbi:MAG: hypothetical protein AAB883_01955 [Patescibacteria group bacterium]